MIWSLDQISHIMGKNNFEYTGCYHTCHICGQWVDIMEHDSNACFDENEIIDITRWGDKQRQGIDKYGYRYVRGKLSKNGCVGLRRITNWPLMNSMKSSPE